MALRYHLPYNVELSIRINCVLQVIERHFTLDKYQKGTDHKLSLEPSEFKQLISHIRHAECIFTKSIANNEIMNFLSTFSNETELNNFKLAMKTVEQKAILECERPCQMKLGKSLVYSRFLELGSILTADMICAKVSEPFGISAERFDEFVGCKLLIEVNFEENLMENHFITFSNSTVG